MLVGTVKGGNAVSGVMRWTPEPGMLKVIGLGVVAVFTVWMAARSVHSATVFPFPSTIVDPVSHTPLAAVALSPASEVEFTVTGPAATV